MTPWGICIPVPSAGSSVPMPPPRSGWPPASRRCRHSGSLRSASGLSLLSPAAFLGCPRVSPGAAGSPRSSRHSRAAGPSGFPVGRPCGRCLLSTYCVPGTSRHAEACHRLQPRDSPCGWPEGPLERILLGVPSPWKFLGWVSRAVSVADTTLREAGRPGTLFCCCRGSDWWPPPATPPGRLAPFQLLFPGQRPRPAP